MPKKDREVTPANGFAAIKDPRMRASIQRIDDRLREGKQETLFGVIEKKRSSRNRELRLLRAMQLECDRRVRELCHDREPVPYTPYSPAHWAILVATDLSELDKLVFIVLERYAIDRRYAWPTQYRIAEDLGKSVRSIKRSVQRLAERGYIWISQRVIKGQKTVNQYELNLGDPRKKRKETL